MTIFLTWYYPILFLIIGLCIGSFVNVVIYRYPIMMLAKQNNTKAKMSLSYPASHCVSCKNKVLKRDNIPVLSWLILKGRCRHCQASFSMRYMLTELFFGFVYLMIAIYFYPTHGLIFTISLLILLSYLYCIFFIDLKHFLIPDAMTYPMLIMGVLCAYFGVIPITFLESIVGAIGIFLIVFITGQLFKYIRKVDGIGFGDFKLFAVGGAWLGILHIQYLIILASIWGVIFYFLNKKFVLTSTKDLEYLDDLNSVKESAIPFGPAICLAIFCNLLLVI